MPTDPTKLYQAAETVLSCVCSALNEVALDEGLGFAGCPCVSYVSAAAPAFDNCCDNCGDEVGGQLTVHVENVFPSDSFPNPTATFEPCRAQTWVAEMVVTVVRCTPTQGGTGGDPTAEELDAVSQTALIDHMTILQALSCCLVQSPFPGRRTRRVQIGEARSLADEGGCLGIEVRAFVEIGRACGCPSEAS